MQRFDSLLRQKGKAGVRRRGFCVLSRDTISKMCRYSAPPGYARSKAPERPKLAPLAPVIDAILEADRDGRPPKQRHTAKRISNGCGSNTTLRR